MKIARFTVLLLILPLAGCLSGRLYHDVVEPLSVNFNNTPVGSKRCVLNTHRVKEPFSGYGISAEWDSAAAADQLRGAGISKVCYTELHTFSILWDVYTRKQIIVYGD